jgi:hypothetical protein
MKYIITESKLPIYILRRLNSIKDRLDVIVQNIFDENEMPFVPFQHFLISVSDYVATEFSHQINGEDFVTIRNQIKQVIRTQFYEYLKEYWESKQM